MTKKTMLCENPACKSHCEVEIRGGAPCFASGFRMRLTSAQSAGFNPESKFNLCASCRTVYDFMLKRAREISKRKLAQ
jgi:hypothetical protein